MNFATRNTIFHFARLPFVLAQRVTYSDGWGDDSPPAQSGWPERDRSAAVLWK
jgi:hypothetical protein